MAYAWYELQAMRVYGIAIPVGTILEFAKARFNKNFASSQAFLQWALPRLPPAEKGWKLLSIGGKFLVVTDGQLPECMTDEMYFNTGTYEIEEYHLVFRSLDRAPKDSELCSRLLQVLECLTGKKCPLFKPGEYCFVGNGCMYDWLVLQEDQENAEDEVEDEDDDDDDDFEEAHDDFEQEESDDDSKSKVQEEPKFHPAFELYCDVFFSVRGQPMGCSRLLLSMNNAVLARMLSNEWKRTDHAIELNDFDPLCFKIFLDAVCKMPELGDLKRRQRKLSRDQRQEMHRIADFFLEDRVKMFFLEKDDVDQQVKEAVAKNPLLKEWKQDNVGLSIAYS